MAAQVRDGRGLLDARPHAGSARIPGRSRDGKRAGSLASAYSVLPQMPPGKPSGGGRDRGGRRTHPDRARRTTDDAFDGAIGASGHALIALRPGLKVLLAPRPLNFRNRCTRCRRW